MNPRDFITARLDEDRTVAEHALAEGALAEVCGDPISTHYSQAVADHVVRHGPDRVLREVAAHRAILEDHGIYQGGGCTGCGTYLGLDDRYHANVDAEDCPNLRALASIWSDHPDYNPAWSTT